MSVQIENFIKELYLLSKEKKVTPSTTLLAKKLGVTKAAITDMAKKLKKKDFINYQPYKEISLTTNGLKKATSIIRKHRLWESFLSHTLKLNKDEIHKEAEALEHQTSEFLINKIDEYLHYPKFDPHGEPIPSTNGTIEKLINCLETAKVNKRYTITHLIASSEEMKKTFDEIGIQIGKELHLKRRLGDSNDLIIEINDTTTMISVSKAKNIYIKEKQI